MNQTHFPPSYPLSQDWSSPRDPQQISVHQPLEAQSLKAQSCIPWRQNPRGIAPAAVGGGATSSSLQARVFLGRFCISGLASGHPCCYSGAGLELLPHVCAPAPCEEMDPAVILGFSILLPSSAGPAVQAQPPGGAGASPGSSRNLWRAQGRGFLFYGGLVLFLYWGASLTEFPHGICIPATQGLDGVKGSVYPTDTGTFWQLGMRVPAVPGRSVGPSGRADKGKAFWSGE